MTAKGFWGNLSAARDSSGTQCLLAPAWKSRNMRLPEPVVIHNGMVFALASGECGISTAKDRNLSSKERISLMAGNAVLYVLDLKTGKELFSSGGSIKGFTHFSAPVVSNGMVYVVNYSSTVYAFGLN
jgi:outer membrane protein assembly factor BamB